MPSFLGLYSTDKTNFAQGINKLLRIAIPKRKSRFGYFLKKNGKTLAGIKKKHYLCNAFLKKNAQMAELVDALVSNTSGFTSMPVRSRLWVQKIPIID